jgi:hypothetical protein
VDVPTLEGFTLSEDEMISSHDISHNALAKLQIDVPFNLVEEVNSRSTASVTDWENI